MAQPSGLGGASDSRQVLLIPAFTGSATSEWSQMTEVEGASHVSMISHPKEVAEVVMTAVRTCAAQPA